MNRPPSDLRFIPDQELLLLELRPRDQHGELDFLRRGNLPDQGSENSTQAEHGQDRDSRWRPIPHRLDWLSEPTGTERRLVCVTAAAGIGKTRLLQQIEGVLGAIRKDKLVLRCHISRLPDSWKQYAHDPMPQTGESLLYSLLEDDFLAIRESDSSKIDDPTRCRDRLYDWLSILLRTGQLTLAVDGLDEISHQDAIVKGAQLRRFLLQHPRVDCVVAGLHLESTAPNACRTRFLRHKESPTDRLRGNWG
ncbi:hypothetical protein [Stieleria varia]|uniref:Uncharacterized protein n=1 Tax=Stieleria varia TaxID=2528005 RepID=A0A5C6B9P6_9BACT|nr:hypothetical protein [Stieleria varia]TWU08362.1 hypothetical protein Pla52n_09440 [Stieleria varia]